MVETGERVNAAIFANRNRIDVSRTFTVAVKDNGPGISPADQGKIFEEFQQAKSGGRDARSGSGLGLAISKQLLELMNGRIWLTSKPGEGSTFYFTVQIYKGQEKGTVTSSTNTSTQTAQPIVQTGA